MPGVVFFGEALYGSVDQVPGVCRVATRFRYVNGFPFYARDSWLIVSPGVKAGVPLANVDGDARGVRLPLSRKSIVTTYVRGVFLVLGSSAAVIVAAFAAVLLTMPPEAPVHPDVWWLFAAFFLVAVVFCGLLWQSYRWTRATTERAAELRALLGLHTGR